MLDDRDTDVEIEETEVPETDDNSDVRAIIEQAYKQESSPSEAEAAAERARDEKGRFARGSEKPAQKVSDQATSVGANEPELKTPAIEVPRSWSAEKRELWSKLPPEAQEYIAQRDREVTQALSRRTSQQPEHAGSFEKDLERYSDVFVGVDPHTGQKQQIPLKEGVAALCEAQRRLTTNFPGAVKEMARANGYHVELRPLTADEAAQPVATPDPLIQKLWREQEELKRQFAERDQQAKASYLNSHIDAFAKETDSQGQLSHPFFNDVRTHMGRIVDYLEQNEPGLSEREYLKRAYDEAVWANPSTRQKLLEHQQREAGRRHKVERAERATSLKGAPGAGSLNVSVGDNVEDIIRAAVEGRI
jgi:hypothetical protein